MGRKGGSICVRVERPDSIRERFEGATRKHLATGGATGTVLNIYLSITIADKFGVASVQMMDVDDT
jgi:hypothetical protein